MGPQGGKLESWQCGPVGRHLLTTLQGNNSQNDPQHQQGVTRPQLILAVVSAEILQMRSTSPLSGRTMLTLMLVKQLSLWWWEVFLTIYCLPPNSWKWVLGGGGPNGGQDLHNSVKPVRFLKHKKCAWEALSTTGVNVSTRRPRSVRFCCTGTTNCCTGKRSSTLAFCHSCSCGAS